MREIKFRAWNHIVNRMSNSYTLAELHEQEVNFTITTFLQFTGLTDKNGQDIYEGDIVRYSVPPLESEEPSVYVEKVTFEEGCFSVDEIVPLGATVHWQVEVVGNIYENPELLNSKLS